MLRCGTVRSRLLTAVALAGALGAFAATSASASGPSVSGAASASLPAATGDAAAIALERKIQKADARVPAITATRRGYLFYTAVGPTGSFGFAYGRGMLAGYRPASESILYVLHGGRITSLVDTARAPGLPALTLIKSAGAAWGRVSPVKCYVTASGLTSALSGYREQFTNVFGHFAPLQRQGRVIIMRSTYPWGGQGGATATEVDRISGTPKHALSYRIKVSAIASTPSFSISGTFHYLAKTPLAHAPTHC
jgi:hypothetical protein